jgi:hypothetical protein
MGGGGAGHAPQVFTPSLKYLREDAQNIGNYFANQNPGSSVATIHNPSLTTANGSSFNNVTTKAISIPTAPEGSHKESTLIGHYSSSDTEITFVFGTPDKNS